MQKVQPVFPAAGKGLGTKRFQLAALYLRNRRSARFPLARQCHRKAVPFCLYLHHTTPERDRAFFQLEGDGQLLLQKLRHGGLFQGKRRASLRRQQSAFF